MYAKRQIKEKGLPWSRLYRDEAYEVEARSERENYKEWPKLKDLGILGAERKEERIELRLGESLAYPMPKKETG